MTQPSGSGEIQPERATRGQLYELAIKVIFPVALLVGTGATSLVLAHESRVTVLETEARAEATARGVESTARAAEATRFQKSLDEIKAKLEKLLEQKHD